MLNPDCPIECRSCSIEIKRAQRLHYIGLLKTVADFLGKDDSSHKALVKAGVRVCQEASQECGNCPHHPQQSNQRLLP